MHTTPSRSRSKLARAFATLMTPGLLVSASLGMLAIAPAAFAQGEQDENKQDPILIEIDDAIANGSGCKKGTSQVFTYHSKGAGSPIDSFLVEHANFAAGKNHPRQMVRVVCNLSLKVGLPLHPDKTKSYQFGLAAVRHSGYMELLEGVKAKVTTTVAMHVEETPLKLKSSTSKEGPFEGDFKYVFDKFYDSEGKETAMWTPCGRESTFNVRTELKLLGKSSKDRRESSLIVDGISNDEDPDKKAKFSQDFRLRWQECDLPS